MKTFKTPKGTELPLLDLRGKDYLQVCYRLVWFREDHPDWSIETEITDLDDKSSLAKAIIKNAESRIMSTSHKYEDAQGFGDFREKAETGAIGRALALIGYGTQFAPDLDEGERIVDSPNERPRQIAGPKSTEPSALCPGCNGKMMVSKYPNKLTGLTDWYCSKCKRSVPREPVQESDIPF